jgi:hypothetical protein
MQGIVFQWAANSWVRGIHSMMTGSHPIVTEEAKNLQFVNIYWSTGHKAVKWAGASGPRNVFFDNTTTKQVTAGAADTPYYPDHTRIYQFGWDGTAFHHLDVGGKPITDWARNEPRDYTGGHGVEDQHGEVPVPRERELTTASPSAIPGGGRRGVQHVERGRVRE